MTRKSKNIISMVLAIIMVLSMLPMQVFAVDGGTSIVLPIGEPTEDTSQSDGRGLRSIFRSSSIPVYISTGAVSVSLPSITKPENMTGSISNARIQAVDTDNTVVAQTSIFSISSYDDAIGNNTLYLLDMLSEGAYGLQVVYGDVQNPTTIGLEYTLAVVDAPVITSGYINNLTAGLNQFTISLTVSGFDGNTGNFSFALIDTDDDDAEVACATNYVSTSSSGTYGEARIEYQVTPSSEIIYGHEYALKITVVSGDLYSTARSISTTAYEATPSEIAILEITANEIVPGQLQVKVGGVDADTDYTVTVALGGGSSSTNYVYNNTLKPTVANGIGVFDIVLTRNGLSLPLSAYGNTTMWVTVSDDQGDEDYDYYQNSDSNSHQSTSLSLSKISDNQYNFTLVGENILLDLYEQGSLSFTLKKYVSGSGYVQVGSTTGSVSKETDSGYWGPNYTFTGIFTTTEILSSGTWYYLHFGEDNIAQTSTIGGGTASTTFGIRSLSIENYDYDTSAFYFNFGQFPVSATLSGSSERAVAQIYNTTTSSVVAQTEEVSGILNSSGYREYSFVIPEPYTLLDMGHSYVLRFVSGGETVSSADYSTSYSSMTYDDTQSLPEYIDVEEPVFVGDTTLKVSVSSSSIKNVPSDYYMNDKIDIISEASDLSLVYTSADAQYTNYDWIITLTLNKPIEFGSYKYIYTKNYAYYSYFTTLPAGVMVLGNASTDQTTKSVSISNCYNLNASTYTAVLYDISDNGYGKLADLTLTKQDNSSLLVSSGLPGNLPNGSYMLEVYADGSYVQTVSVYISWNSDDASAIVIKGYQEFYTGEYYTLEEITYQTDSAEVYLYTSNPDYAYVRYSENSNFGGVSYAPIRDYWDQYLTLSAGNGVKTIYVQFRTTSGTESDVYTWTCEKVSEVVEPEIVEAKLTVGGSEAYIVPSNTEFTISLISTSQLVDCYVEFWNEKDSDYYYTTYPFAYRGSTEGGYLFEAVLNSGNMPFSWSTSSSDYYNFTAANCVLTDFSGDIELDSIEIPISFRTLTNIVLSDWESYGGTLYTNNDDFAVKGQASPNSTVTITTGSNSFQSTASSSGAFSVTVTGLTEGTHRITASDSEGLSTSSHTYNLVVDQTPPVLDTFKATAESSNITLTWTTSNTDIAYYLLWKDDAALVRAADTYTSKSYITTGGIGSTFKVVAVDRAGNQSAPKEVTVGDEEPPTVPGTPTMTSRGTKNISFSWEASTDNVAVYQYEVYRGDTLLETVSYGVNSYTDDILTEDTSYTYKVYALDRAGNKSAAAEASLSTAVLSITNSTSFSSEYVKEENPDGVSVSMTLDNSDSYYSIAGVTAKLQYKLSTAESWSELALTGTAAYRSGTWIIEDLPIGTYTVRFYAADTEETEKTTAEASITISQDTIPPVVSITAPTASSTQGGKDLRISGTSSDNVEVDKIELSYSTDGGSNYTAITTLTNIKTSGRTSYTWNHTFDAVALPSGAVTIKAAAFDGRDNTSDATVVITLDNTPPSAPSDFSVTGTSRYIHVMWDSAYSAPADFSHFNVYRATSEHGEYTCVRSSGKSIGYFDDGETATAGTTYYYYVTAEDTYGNESNPTAVASAKLVADTESPTIGDMQPSNNASLRRSVSLRVTAADNYRLAKAVFEYRLSGTDSWTMISEVAVSEIANNTTFSHSWDISALAAGTYEIRTSVYDDSINDVESNSGYIPNSPAVITRTVTIEAYNSPVAPTVTVTSGYKTAAINWTYAGDVDALSQFLIYSTDSAGENRSYAGAVSGGASGSYTLSIPADGTQYFVVAAKDSYGEYAYSNVVSATSAGSDTEDPVAVIMPETLAAVSDTAFKFSAINSTDNDEITSYTWNFGDGQNGSGVIASNTYATPGTYTVTLTVADKSGNTGTAQATVGVYDITAEDAEYALMTLNVVNGYVSGTPALPGASVKIYDNEGFETTAVTDSSGVITAVVPIGEITVSAVCEGYVSNGRAVTIEPEADGTFTLTIGLRPINVSFVDGSLSSTEMTYDEILAAGIDVTNPDNEHVWEFAATLEFVAGPALPFTLPITAYVNSAGDFVGGSGFGWFSGSGGGGGGFGGMNIGVFLSEKFLLVIYGEAHWLKEMYNVELLVFNNSYTDDITDCVATLVLPDGLSLASMTGEAQSETINLGTIPKKTSEYDDANMTKATWYVRGDAEGEYYLSAVVTGNAPTAFLNTFTTPTPVKVYAGSALKLTITADDIAYSGEEYNVQFKLENVSHKNLYNLSFGITGAEQFKVIQIGSGTAELRLTHEDFGDGMTQPVDVLAPGGSITIDFSTTTWFNSYMELLDLGPLEVGYYLTNVFVTTLEGSTTSIPYEIQINHVNHGSFFEWLWDEAKDKVEKESISLLDEEFFGDIGLLKHAKKLYKFMTTDTTDASSKAVITVEGGYAISANNFLRNQQNSTLSRSFSANENVIVVSTDADESNYTISPDGKTLTITGTANVYVEGEAEGTATMTVTTYVFDEEADDYTPNVYTLNYAVSGESAEAVGVILQAPDSDTIAMPLKGNTTQVIFPYALIDADGNFIMDAPNAEWTINGTNNSGLSITNGTLTIDSSAKAGSYTVRLKISDSVYEEQTITLTREPAVATEVKLYRGEVELEGTDTLIIPIGDEADTYTYSAKLFDQYGDEIAASFVWETSSNTSDATVNNGIISLTKNTSIGSLTLTAISNGKSASVILTITNVTVDWNVIVAKPAITYGDSKASAFTALPSTGTATATGTLNGTFSIVDADEILEAGSNKTITVEFTVTTAGDYMGTKITKDYTVTVNPKPITVTVTAASREYGAANPSFEATAASGALVGTDTIAGLGLTLSSTADANSAPGTYNVTGTATNTNYTVTVSGANKLTVTKAALTLTGTPSFAAILANNTDNDTLAALTAAVQAANPTLSASYANGTTTLDAAWALKTGTYDRKGGTYTFEAALTPTNDTNFSYNGVNATVQVVVTPVTGTPAYSPTTLTKVGSEIDAASDMSDLGLPTGITVSYDNGVSGDTYSITGWNYTLAQLQAIDASTADVQRELTPTVDFPAWATIDTSGLKTTLTITSKYPVTVNVTVPAGVTYGTALGDPVPSQVAISNGTDAGASWTYLYEGATKANQPYSSSVKPTQAGTYTVTATLVSDTHSGSGTSAAFTIAQKTLDNSMLDITGTYKFTGTAITPTYTITDGSLLASSDYDAEITDNISAGNGTITVTARATGNYAGTATKTFAIEKADAPTVSNIEREYNKDNATTGVRIDLAASLPNNCGTVSYVLTKSGTAATNNAAVDASGILTFDTIAGSDGDEEELSIAVTMQNYENITIKVTITLVDKETPTGSPVVTGSLNYGQKLSVLPISVTMTNGSGNTVEGTITWESPDSIPVVGAPDQAWVFTPDDDTSYSSVYGTAAITVSKSIPTGTPAYDKITTSGKTLADANLVGTFTNRYNGDPVPGTLSWNDADSTSVTANTSYGWTFTPNDTSNYEVTTGSITLYTAGGSTINPGGNTGGDTTTEVGSSTITTPSNQKPVENADGSVTLPGGGTVEIGSGDNAVVVNAPAGTIVNKDGSVTIPDNKSAELELSNSGATVTAPGGTTISSDGEITIGAGEAKVNLPNGTEITVSEGSTMVSSGEIEVGKNGASLSNDQFEIQVPAGETLIPKEDSLFGYVIDYDEGFTDIPKNAWYEEAVQGVFENGIMNGVGDGKFAPNDNLNRAMLVQMFYNIQGRLDAGKPDFDDVSSNAWYADAIAWASANGIVNGVGGGNFAPETSITREQMAVMLYRFCEFKGIKLTEVTDTTVTDRSEVSDWALEAVEAMYKAGILSGKGSGVFDPKGTATRAEVAQMMMNFLEAIK